MNRSDFIRRLDEPFDVAVIGGGASGLGAAVDAASRGLRVVLLEQSDFAKGTSSRSTKLIHGGVRYLRQGDIAMVRHALHERGLLLRNAPHLVHPLSFVIPARTHAERLFYGAGLKIYDLLAGKLGIQRSRLLSKAETLHRLPGIQPGSLCGGVLYQDAQFDDAGLAVALARTLVALGGVPLNYCKVTALPKHGICAIDFETGHEHQIRAKVVINATGVFADAIRRMDKPTCETLLAPSQGVHLVLPRAFLPGDAALMIPKTDDGRVLFAIPWHGSVLLGTTDTPVSHALLEPRPLEDEVDYLLEHARRYFSKPPQRGDVLSMFAGLRPLVKRSAAKNTAALSRDHIIQVSSSGLITLIGGKWTTYRKMGEDVIDTAIKVGGLTARPTQTTELKLAVPDDAITEPVLRAIRTEMARTVEDVLARRSRLLFTDARRSMEEAPQVAAMLARELGRDETWQARQVAEFRELAGQYLPH